MWTKTQAKDIKNTAFLTTGTAPDYELTIPRETSYADMDRQEFLVNFHSAGSWTITLNINWLWAKDTGLTAVNADDYYTFVYDLSQDIFDVVWWGATWWPWSDTTAVHIDTAWEIAWITEKTNPHIHDKLIIEDSEDSNNKKMIELSNILWSWAGTMIEDTVITDLNSSSVVSWTWGTDTDTSLVWLADKNYNALFWIKLLAPNTWTIDVHAYIEMSDDWVGWWTQVVYEYAEWWNRGGIRIVNVPLIKWKYYRTTTYVSSNTTWDYISDVTMKSLFKAVWWWSQTLFVSDPVSSIPDWTQQTFTHNLNVTQADVEAWRYATLFTFSVGWVAYNNPVMWYGLWDANAYIVAEHKRGTTSWRSYDIAWQSNTITVTNNWWGGTLNNVRVAIVDNWALTQKEQQWVSSSWLGNFVVPVNWWVFAIPTLYWESAWPIIWEDSWFIITRDTNSPYEIYKNNSTWWVDYNAWNRQQINWSNNNSKIPVANWYIYAILSDWYMYKISVNSDISVLWNWNQLFDASGMWNLVWHNWTNIVMAYWTNINEVNESWVQQSTCSVWSWTYWGVIVGNSSEFLYWNIDTGNYWLYSMVYWNSTQTQISYIWTKQFNVAFERWWVVYVKWNAAEDATMTPIYKLA